MLKNPFQRGEDKFRILPSITSNNARDVVAKKLLNIYIGYWGTFALWLIVSYNFIPMIFTLTALMWILGGIAAMKIPPESGNIARKTRFSILTYIVGLLAFRFIIYIIIKTPVELWQKVFMVEVQPAFASSFMGFLTMAFIVGMFMGFVGYLNYIMQLFLFHKADKKTSDYMKTIMRREDDR